MLTSDFLSLTFNSFLMQFSISFFKLLYKCINSRTSCEIPNHFSFSSKAYRSNKTINFLTEPKLFCFFFHLSFFKKSFQLLFETISYLSNSCTLCLDKIKKFFIKCFKKWKKKFYHYRGLLYIFDKTSAFQVRK